jgi:Zn ribbon nucleic-acid-binding protein
MLEPGELPMPTVPCPRCQQDRGFYARTREDGATVFECVQCATRFVDPEVPEEEQPATAETR